MSIEIIRDGTTKTALRELAGQSFGDFVKAVVDTGRGIMAVGGDMHADEEAVLLEDDSNQQHLWGINLYPDLPDDQWVEFDSMINVRPRDGNRTRDVENPETRNAILAIVARLVRG